MVHHLWQPSISFSWEAEIRRAPPTKVRRFASLPESSGSMKKSGSKSTNAKFKAGAGTASASARRSEPWNVDMALPSMHSPLDSVVQSFELMTEAAIECGIELIAADTPRSAARLRSEARSCTGSTFRVWRRSIAPEPSLASPTRSRAS